MIAYALSLLARCGPPVRVCAVRAVLDRAVVVRRAVLLLARHLAQARLLGSAWRSAPRASAAARTGPTSPCATSATRRSCSRRSSPSGCARTRVVRRGGAAIAARVGSRRAAPLRGSHAARAVRADGVGAPLASRAASAGSPPATVRPTRGSWATRRCGPARRSASWCSSRAARCSRSRSARRSGRARRGCGAARRVGAAACAHGSREWTTPKDRPI